MIRLDTLVEEVLQAVEKRETPILPIPLERRGHKPRPRPQTAIISKAAQKAIEAKK